MEFAPYQSQIRNWLENALRSQEEEPHAPAPSRARAPQGRRSIWRALGGIGGVAPAMLFSFGTAWSAPGAIPALPKGAVPAPASIEAAVEGFGPHLSILQKARWALSKEGPMFLPAHLKSMLYGPQGLHRTQPKLRRLLSKIWEHLAVRVEDVHFMMRKMEVLREESHRLRRVGVGGEVVVQNLRKDAEDLEYRAKIRTSELDKKFEVIGKFRPPLTSRFPSARQDLMEYFTALNWSRKETKERMRLLREELRKAQKNLNALDYRRDPDRVLDVIQRKTDANEARRNALRPASIPNEVFRDPSVPRPMPARPLPPRPAPPSAQPTPQVPSSVGGMEDVLRWERENQGRNKALRALAGAQSAPAPARSASPYSPQPASPPSARSPSSSTYESLPTGPTHSQAAWGPTHPQSSRAPARAAYTEPAESSSEGVGNYRSHPSDYVTPEERRRQSGDQRRRTAKEIIQEREALLRARMRSDVPGTPGIPTGPADSDDLLDEFLDSPTVFDPYLSQKPPGARPTSSPGKTTGAPSDGSLLKVIENLLGKEGNSQEPLPATTPKKKKVILAQNLDKVGQGSIQVRVGKDPNAQRNTFAESLQRDLLKGAAREGLDATEGFGSYRRPDPEKLFAPEPNSGTGLRDVLEEIQPEP